MGLHTRSVRADFRFSSDSPKVLREKLRTALCTSNSCMEASLQSACPSPSRVCRESKRSTNRDYQPIAAHLLQTRQRPKHPLIAELLTSGLSVSAANIATLPMGKELDKVPFSAVLLHSATFPCNWSSCLLKVHLARLHSASARSHALTLLTISDIAIADVLKVRLQLQTAQLAGSPSGLVRFSSESLMLLWWLLG